MPINTIIIDGCEMVTTFKVGDSCQVLKGSPSFNVGEIVTIREIVYRPHLINAELSDNMLYFTTKPNVPHGFWAEEMELAQINWKRKLGGIKCQN